MTEVRNLSAELRELTQQILTLFIENGKKAPSTDAFYLLVLKECEMTIQKAIVLTTMADELSKRAAEVAAKEPEKTYDYIR